MLTDHEVTADTPLHDVPKGIDVQISAFGSTWDVIGFEGAFTVSEVRGPRAYTMQSDQAEDACVVTLGDVVHAAIEEDHFVDTIARVAHMISKGLVLMTARYSVGTYGQTGGFACLTLRGDVRPSYCEVEESVPDAFSPYGIGVVMGAEEDLSSFGAAKTFVEIVTVRGAQFAIARAKEKHLLSTAEVRAD